MFKRAASLNFINYSTLNYDDDRGTYVYNQGINNTHTSNYHN